MPQLDIFTFYNQYSSFIWFFICIYFFFSYNFIPFVAFYFNFYNFININFKNFKNNFFIFPSSYFGDIMKVESFFYISGFKYIFNDCFFKKKIESQYKILDFFFYSKFIFTYIFQFFCLEFFTIFLVLEG